MKRIKAKKTQADKAPCLPEVGYPMRVVGGDYKAGQNKEQINRDIAILDKLVVR
jgi:hypothetical protein